MDIIKLERSDLERCSLTGDEIARKIRRKNYLDICRDAFRDN